MSACSNNCKIITFMSVDNLIILRPVLYRTTHKKCNLCKNPVSDYSHNVCYYCANKENFPYEYDYHHSCCS